MKKLLATLTFAFTVAASSQTFVKHYDHVLKKDRINNEIDKIEDIKLSVIFSGNDKGDIVFYFDSGEAQRYYKTGTIRKGVSKDKLQYRYITALAEDNTKIIIQLFDNGVLRMHYQDYTMQYMEYKEQE